MLIDQGLVAAANHSAADTTLGIAVIPVGLVIIYMTLMVVIRYGRAKGATCRREVFERVLGEHQAHYLSWFISAYAVALLLLVAILKA